MDITVIKSRRRTMAIEVRHDGKVFLRAPFNISDALIRDFAERKRPWIEKHIAEAERKRNNSDFSLKLNSVEKEALRLSAKDLFEERLNYYAPLVGVKYNKLSVRMQKARFGSCSRGGKISLNCLLLLAPEDVRDSVIVHELCHLKHMNHSKEFYKEILRVFPNYPNCRKWLRDHGDELLAAAREE